MRVRDRMSFIVSVLNRSDTCEVSTALRISEYSVLPFAGCGTSSSTGTEVRVSPPVNQTSDAVEPDDIDAVFNKLNSVTDD